MRLSTALERSSAAWAGSTTQLLNDATTASPPAQLPSSAPEADPATAAGAHSGGSPEIDTIAKTNAADEVPAPQHESAPTAAEEPVALPDGGSLADASEAPTSAAVEGSADASATPVLAAGSAADRGGATSSAVASTSSHAVQAAPEAAVGDAADGVAAGDATDTGAADGTAGLAMGVGASNAVTSDAATSDAAATLSSPTGAADGAGHTLSSPPQPPPSTPTAGRSAPGSPKVASIARSYSEHSALCRASDARAPSAEGGRRGGSGHASGIWNSPALMALDTASHVPGLPNHPFLQPAITADTRRGGAGIPNPCRVLTDPGRLPGKLHELSQALEALGTPLEGVPVEVASQLQLRVAEQERTTSKLRKECAAQSSARSAAEAELERQRRENAELRRQLQQLATAQTAAEGVSADAPSGVAAAAASGEVSSVPGTEAAAAAGTGSAATHRGGGPIATSASAASLDAHGERGASTPHSANASCTSAAEDGGDGSVLQASHGARSDGGVAADHSAPTVAVMVAGPSSAVPIAPLRHEIAILEKREHELAAVREVLLGSVRVAMSCLPPPGPLRSSGATSGSGSSSGSGSGMGCRAGASGGSTSSSPTGCRDHSEGSCGGASGGSGGGGGGGSGSGGAAAGAASVGSGAGACAGAGADAGADGGGGSSPTLERTMIGVGGASASSLADSVGAGGAAGADGAEGGGPLSVVQRIAADLCSSARQAAHANARLGHAMATEREAHKLAVALAQKRVSFIGADVNARLLFLAQPSRHPAESPPSGAFSALLLPTLPSGRPTHWLSAESVESLRRWCDEEGTPLNALRAVIGRVVHVAGPYEVPSAGPGSTGGCAAPHHLAPGEKYYEVHAEMMLQYRWATL